LDLGADHFEWTLDPGSLRAASGRVPLPGGPNGAVIAVEWRRLPDNTVSCTFTTPHPISLHINANQPAVEISGTQTLRLAGDSRSGWQQAD
jgi:hypothetical protein